MKISKQLLLAALATTLQIAPFQSVSAVDGCSSAPCLNGGACTPLGAANYSCECASGFLGPSCAYASAGDEQITVDFDGTGGGATYFLGFHLNTEESGLGQSFLTSIGGTLENVSFNLIAQQEAVDNDEELIVEFWATDGFGVPTGSALASRSLAGGSFTPNATEIRTVNFAADEVLLQPATGYAFTLRVLNKAVIGDSLFIVLDHNTESGAYPFGTMVNLPGGTTWNAYSNDWDKFQVTVTAPLFEDGFETLTPP